MYRVQKIVLGKFAYWLDSELKWNGLKENGYKFSHTEATVQLNLLNNLKKYDEEYSIKLIK